jgi:hypothetical protein
MKKPFRVTEMEKKEKGYMKLQWVCLQYFLSLHYMMVLYTSQTLTTSVIVGYDFQESNEKFLNVLALYNSSYQNNSFIPTLPFGLRRVSRSLNVVGATNFVHMKLSSIIDPLIYESAKKIEYYKYFKIVNSLIYKNKFTPNIIAKEVSELPKGCTLYLGPSRLR